MAPTLTEILIPRTTLTALEYLNSASFSLAFYSTLASLVPIPSPYQCDCESEPEDFETESSPPANMKEILKNNVIAITGDFGKQRTPEALKRWIESNGGHYVTKIDENTTHLICSHEAWKKQVGVG
jgi:NAD-dependent DNA ligase